MTRISDRLRAGLRILAASTAPSGEDGLEDVGGVDGPLGAARPHDGVELVNEEDHVAHPADLRQGVFHPLLKFSPVLGARQHSGEIDGQDVFPRQLLRHIAVDDPLGQSLRHGGRARR